MSTATMPSLGQLAGEQESVGEHLWNGLTMVASLIAHIEELGYDYGVNAAVDGLLAIQQRLADALTLDEQRARFTTMEVTDLVTPPTAGDFDISAEAEINAIEAAATKYGE